MNFLQKILLFSALFAISAAAFAQEGPSVRVLYFSDEYSIGSNLQNAFQDVLLKGGTLYTIDRVEKLPTLFNGNSYILNLPPDIEDSALEETNVYYKSIGKKEAVITGSSLMVQSPSFDKNIKEALLKTAQDGGSAKNYVAADMISARTGLLALNTGGTLEVLSTDIGRLKGSWVPAVLVNYHLYKGLDKSIVSIFEKPLGGIGAWSDAVADITAQEKEKPLIISTGGYYPYESLGQQPQFFADYWKELKADALAVNPKDIEFLLSVQKETQDIPPLLASNIEPEASDAPNPFVKTLLIERGGIKTGIFSLVQEAPLRSADGKNIAYKVTDADAAAQQAVNDLRFKDKADFIILVSHLDDTELNKIFQNVYGVDMVITAQRKDNSSLRKHKIELEDWNRERHYTPAYISAGNGYVLGDTRITFKQNSGGLTPALIEDGAPRDLYYNNTFSNRFYAVNKQLFSGITKKGGEILPSAKKVSAYGQERYLSYTPLEFFNMAAAIIKKQTKSEVSLVKILPFNEQFLGNLTEEEVKKWLGADDPVLNAAVKGDTLKKILKYADFSPVFNGNTTDYSLSAALACAGATKDGDTYKINALSVNDDEFYYISFPASLMQERFIPADVKNSIFIRKEAPLKLHGAVIDYLKKIKETNKRAAAALFDSYMQDYNFRKENNLPPQDEITQQLDLKMQDIGPQAVQEYFEEENGGEYTKELFALMENRPQIYGQWRYNLKNLSLQATSTEVKNAQYYQNFSNSRLTSDSQKVLQGRLNAAAEYYKDRIRWNNNLLLEYGRVSLRSYSGAKSSNESMDKISLSTDYTYKCIDVKDILGGFLLGPFLSLGYDTEFTRPADAPRYKALRGKGGIRLFEGKYLKDLYLALAPEVDFTYAAPSNKYAWEFGVKLEQPVNPNTKAIYRAMVRDFFVADNKNNTDYSYEIELDTRLETEVWRKFSVAPFITYYQAKAKGFDQKGSNLYIGVSLSYSRLFKRLPF